jgi:type II secretory pathway component PulC
METLTVEVVGASTAIAMREAVQKARQQLFDPIRVVSVRETGEGISGLYTYTVDVLGVALTEAEAREIYGR